MNDKIYNAYKSGIQNMSLEELVALDKRMGKRLAYETFKEASKRLADAEDYRCANIYLSMEMRREELKRGKR